MLKSKRFTQKLVKSGLCKPQEIRGCTDADIDNLNEGLPCKLPSAYTNLMLVIGRSAGTLLDDVTFFYPAILGLTEESRKFLSGLGVILPENVFVFSERNYEQIVFFYIDTGKSDPPIYLWTDESPKEFRKVYESIWQFIDDELTASIDTM